MGLEVVNLSSLISLTNIVICSYISVRDNRIGIPGALLKEVQIVFVDCELGSAIIKFPLMVSHSLLTRLPLEDSIDLFLPWLTFHVYTTKL